jgi:ferritin-like metal-binding protein YciE
MEIKTLREMYTAELQELASVERQLAECLPRVAEAASHPSLKAALLHHQEETELQKERLESLLKKHSANPAGHIDQAMQALVCETEKMLTLLKGRVRDAGLVASLQRLKHYEIAVYGTVVSLANQLELSGDERVLLANLEEEKHMDKSLTMLAEDEINPDALAV